ncbi:hypothetical protein AOX55_00006555 (plasmid) [Sinorhizobium fredii CCBAU 25509]|nr:hypothetical protein AOX55_00006555 [Sinorhizobium fredii CCBAU 25509]
MTLQTIHSCTTLCMVGHVTAYRRRRCNDCVAGLGHRHECVKVGHRSGSDADFRKFCAEDFSHMGNAGTLLRKRGNAGTRQPSIEIRGRCWRSASRRRTPRLGGRRALDTKHKNGSSTLQNSMSRLSSWS